MKVTPKFQKGGGFEPFFTTYVPIQTESPRQAPQQRGASRRDSSSDDNEKGKLTEKDFFNMIKDVNGLPNEMMELVTNLMDTFRLSNLTGVDPSNLATTYLQNLYQVKIASQNKAKFDKAVENAGTNGAMAEPAISMDGKLIIQDENGKLGTVKLETYFANPEKYRDRVMTVSNLAYYRQYDPSLVNNQSAFDIINNSMGFESFQKLIDQAKMALGSSEYKSSGMFQYDAKALQGLKVLQSLQESDQAKALGAVTAEGLYKYNIIDKTQLGQIKALTTYMRAILPDRAKTWAAFKLNTANKEKATEDLVFQYLLSGNTTSHSFDIDYKGEMDHVMGKSKSSKSGGSEEEPKETFLTSLQKGQGGRYEVRRLNPGGQGDFKVSGTVYGSFLDQDGKTVTDTNLADLLAKTGIAGITDIKSITFGDNWVNPNSLSHIAVENGGGVWAALPYIKKDGKIAPNFQLIESFNDLVQEVNAELGDNASAEKRQELLEKKIQGNQELQDLLDMTGKLDPNKVCPFFIVNGLASDLNFQFTTNEVPISEKPNPLISATDSKENIEYFKKTTNPVDFDDNDSILGDVLFGGHNTIYKSNVFIPIQTTNRLAAIIFSGQKIKNSTAEAIEKEYQAAEVPDLRTTDSTLLYR